MFENRKLQKEQEALEDLIAKRVKTLMDSEAIRKNYLGELANEVGVLKKIQWVEIYEGLEDALNEANRASEPTPEQIRAVLLAAHELHKNIEKFDKIRDNLSEIDES